MRFALRTVSSAALLAALIAGCTATDSAPVAPQRSKEFLSGERDFRTGSHIPKKKRDDAKNDGVTTVSPAALDQPGKPPGASDR
jgi:predicted lysophospholipase L1 biosynthesis ABC-type transport system permease subunit